MGDLETAWERVGRALRERAQALFPLQADLVKISGVSATSLRAYYGGQPIARGDKRRALCRALEWPDDAIERLLDGADPNTFDDEDPTPTGGSSVELLAAQVADMQLKLDEIMRMLERVNTANRPSPPVEQEDG